MKYFLVGLISLINCAAFAQLKFDGAKIYAPLKGATATAGYVTITNTGSKDVDLSVESAQGFKAAETHESIEQDGRMSMRQVESFRIPAGNSVELKPGGKHIMLFQPNEDAKEGVKLKIRFRSNQKTFEVVEFSVVPRSESISKDHKGH